MDENFQRDRYLAEVTIGLSGTGNVDLMWSASVGADVLRKTNSETDRSVWDG